MSLWRPPTYGGEPLSFAQARFSPTKKSLGLWIQGGVKSDDNVMVETASMRSQPTTSPSITPDAGTNAVQYNTSLAAYPSLHPPTDYGDCLNAENLQGEMASLTPDGGSGHHAGYLPDATPAGAPAQKITQGAKGKRKSYDNGDSMEEISPKRKLNSNGGKLMVCPYYRRDPTKYAQCWKYKLVGYNPVKQHVLRRHAMPEYYCSICWCPFETHTAWRAHTTPADCQEAPRPDHYGPDLVDRDGRDDLKNKLPSTCNDDETKWRWLFRFIFKGCHEPKSVWRDDPKYEAATLLGHDYGFGPEEVFRLLEKNSKICMPVSDRTLGLQLIAQRQTGFVESHSHVAQGDATYLVPNAAHIGGINSINMSNQTQDASQVDGPSGNSRFSERDAVFQVSPTQVPTASGQGLMIGREAASPRIFQDAPTSQTTVAVPGQYLAINAMTSTNENPNHHFYFNLDPSLLDDCDSLPNDFEWVNFDPTNGNSSLFSPDSREP